MFATLEEAIKAVHEFKIKLASSLKKQKDISRNDEGHAFITTKNGLNVIVDDDDYNELCKYVWHITAQGYAATSSKKLNGSKLMHRFLMQYSGDGVVDHINNKKLVNRKENLRICTYRENSINRTPKKAGYLGVKETGNKWQASIKVNGKVIYLGCFNTLEEAAMTRDKATIKYFGEYGKLNYPLTST
ncbi:hypothetical protein EB077_08760 [bacterium]|nr:hypothetical protein [bacterium]